MSGRGGSITSFAKKGARLGVGLGVLLAILACLIPAARLFFFAVTPAARVPAEDASKVIVVPSGQGAIQLSIRLRNEGIISDANHFLWVGRIRMQLNDVKAGEYKLSPSMTPMQIWETITSGISVQYPLTIREGQNMYEIADDLQKQSLAKRSEFLKLCEDKEFMRELGFQDPLPPSLEGYLFPDTYFFNSSMGPKAMIQQMVSHFRGVWKEEFDAQAKSLGMTRHQIVTLASIVEKETGAPEERPMISSVFHNRLKKRMRLQSDPTTIYGMWEEYDGNIRKKDLSRKNPYNTYTIPALPIGPIGNPGKASIEAALNPDGSDYLFFVSQNDGRHVFTRSYEEHRRAVQEYQLNRAAREGKSWRDLHKDTQSQ